MRGNGFWCSYCTKAWLRSNSLARTFRSIWSNWIMNSCFRFHHIVAITSYLELTSLSALHLFHPPSPHLHTRHFSPAASTIHSQNKNHNRESSLLSNDSGPGIVLAHPLDLDRHWSWADVVLLQTACSSQPSLRRHTYSSAYSYPPLHLPSPSMTCSESLMSWFADTLMW